MTWAPLISLPDQFNAAAYSIDRRLADGRSQKTAIECGDVRVSEATSWLGLPHWIHPSS
jgi:hypothetical protein